MNVDGLVAGLDNNFLGNDGLVAVRHWSVFNGSGDLLDGSVDGMDLLVGSQDLGSQSDSGLSVGVDSGCSDGVDSGCSDGHMMLTGYSKSWLSDGERWLRDGDGWSTNSIANWSGTNSKTSLSNGQMALMAEWQVAVGRGGDVDAAAQHSLTKIAQVTQVKELAGNGAHARHV